LEVFKVVFDGIDFSDDQRERLQGAIEGAVRESLVGGDQKDAPRSAVAQLSFVDPSDLLDGWPGRTRGLIGIPPDLDPDEIRSLADREFGGG